MNARVRKLLALENQPCHGKHEAIAARLDAMYAKLDRAERVAVWTARAERATTLAYREHCERMIQINEPEPDWDGSPASGQYWGLY